jgi:topoisomerase-4 subunit A
MKITAERDELEEERAKINVTLGSKARLKTLIKDELKSDAKKYGDERRSPIIDRRRRRAGARRGSPGRQRAGHGRAVAEGLGARAKGHDIDAAALSYREGDSFRSSAKGKTTQNVAFIDSTGSSYSTPTHTLPSARGNGEPLTGRFTPPPGAHFEAVAIADSTSKLVLASDHGYGFVDPVRRPAGEQEGRQAD